MLKTLKLLFPALIPSWNFFDVIAPSPRIQYALFNDENDNQIEWQEFSPRPGKVSFSVMLRRMLWNPVWNEYLFMVSCAERLLEQPTPHSESEILKRIVNYIRSNSSSSDKTYLQFRLLLVSREGDGLKQELMYESQRVAMSGYDSKRSGS